MEDYNEKSVSVVHRCGNEDIFRSYQKLEELEFDSFRKCMTVMVRCKDTDVIHVLTKVFTDRYTAL